jgi:hypothetical protein
MALGPASESLQPGATATSGLLACDVCFQDAANLISTAEMRRIADWQHWAVTRLYAIESQMAKAAVPVPTSL